MHPQQLTLLTPDPTAGARGKADGMARADNATDPTWREQCDAAIDAAARTGEEFQAAHLRKWYGLPEPADHHQWGPRFLAASQRGVIRATGYAPCLTPGANRSACRTWTGTHVEA